MAGMKQVVLDEEVFHLFYEVFIRASVACELYDMESNEFDEAMEDLKQEVDACEEARQTKLAEAFAKD